MPRPSYLDSGYTNRLLSKCGHPNCKSKASHAILQQTAAAQQVNAERVFQLERKMKKAGFTEQQARGLLVTTARLRRLREQINMEDMGKLFQTAWQVEDDMIQAGFTRERARQLGAMFVALAGSRTSSDTRYYEEYWVFWEVSAVSRVDAYLTQAGADRTKTYELARAMLNFAVQEWRS